MARHARSRTSATRWTMLGLLTIAIATAGVGPATATVRPTKLADTTIPAADPAPDIRTFEGRHGLPAEADQALGARSAPLTLGQSTYQLTLTGIDRAGQVITATSPHVWAKIVNLDTGETVVVRLKGPTAVAVPIGRLAISATIWTPLAKQGTYSQTFVLLPEIRVSGPVDVTLDARRGRQAILRPDDPTAVQVEGGAFVVQETGGGSIFYPAFPLTSTPDQLFLTPTGYRSDIKLHLYAQWWHHDLRPSPYVYELIHSTIGGIPDLPGYEVRQTDLAAVTTSYASQAGSECAYLEVGPVVPAVSVRVSFGLQLPPLPTTRVEYVSPGIEWASTLSHGDASCQGDFDFQFAKPVSYPGPGSYTAPPWNTAPFGPAADQIDAPAQRQGDVVSVQLPMFADSQLGHLGGLEPGGAEGTTTLRRDGVLLGSSPTVGIGEFAVPAGPGSYELTVRCTRDVTWSKLSTRQEATWTFAAPAGGTDPQSLPLLTVRATPLLDMNNAAPGDTQFKVPLRVTRAPGAPVAPTARVAAEVSYDEGTTWQPASVVGAGDNWTALLHHPANGTVSLRIKAADSSGNAVIETMIRAYGLRTG